MKSLSITLPTVVCVLMVCVVCVRGAILPGHHKSSESHPKPSGHFLILDQVREDSSRSIRPINNDSISPWEYTQVRDPDYYPEVISSARCLLTGCLNMSGVEVLDVESKPILREILVLKKVRVDEKNYIFKLEHKTISVGCTCVRPYVQQI